MRLIALTSLTLALLASSMPVSLPVDTKAPTPVVPALTSGGSTGNAALGAAGGSVTAPADPAVALPGKGATGSVVVSGSPDGTIDLIGSGTASGSLGGSDAGMTGSASGSVKQRRTTGSGGIQVFGVSAAEVGYIVGKVPSVAPAVPGAGGAVTGALGPLSGASSATGGSSAQAVKRGFGLSGVLQSIFGGTDSGAETGAYAPYPYPGDATYPEALSSTKPLL